MDTFSKILNLSDRIVSDDRSDTHWQSAAQKYLQRLGEGEYKEGLAAHLKAGRKRNTYRHSPSEYHRTLVEFLGKNDEEGFKSYKLTNGYHNVLKH